MKWINKLLLSIVWVGLVASCSDDDSHELPVISPVSTGTFTDTRDDNTYNYVRIGNLEWMTENCRYRTSDCKYYVDYGNTGQTIPIGMVSFIPFSMPQTLYLKVGAFLPMKISSSWSEHWVCLRQTQMNWIGEAAGQVH